MSPRLVALGAALAVALYLAVWGERTPSGAALARSPAAQTTSGPFAEVTPPADLAPGPAVSGHRESAIPELIPREQLIGRGGATARDAAAPSLFAATSPAPPASAPSIPETAAQTVPPLPYVYLGKQRRDETWQVFLRRENGDAVVVMEGDEIDGLYRVGSIRPPAMTLMYLPLRQPQTLVVE